jgi:hypothetical protein
MVSGSLFWLDQPWGLYGDMRRGSDCSWAWSIWVKRPVIPILVMPCVQQSGEGTTSACGAIRAAYGKVTAV